MLTTFSSDYAINATGFIMVTDGLIEPPKIYDRPSLISLVNTKDGHSLKVLSKGASYSTIVKHEFIARCYILDPITP